VTLRIVVAQGGERMGGLTELPGDADGTRRATAPFRCDFYSSETMRWKLFALRPAA
jgi:hypothetical protein